MCIYTYIHSNDVPPARWNCLSPLAGADPLPSEPVVSVLIPTYRRPGLLGHALGLVAAQDYPPELVEVVVVEDGPCSLGEVAGAEAFARLRPRLVYIHLGAEQISINCMLRQIVHS